MNSAHLIGRLTKDPELKTTPAGTAYCNFTLAVDRPKNVSTGEQKADFISIKGWGKRAEIAAQFLQKGSLVAIRGNIQTSSYVAQDGNRRYVTVVVIDEMKFIDTRRNAQQVEQRQEPVVSAEAYGTMPAGGFIQVEDDDLPF